jgi:starch synthase (maltosyl-transferring)
MPRKSTPPPAAPAAASKATKSSAAKPKVVAPTTTKAPAKVVKKVSPAIEIGITEPVADERSIFCFENVQPSVDGGLFACKFEIGDTLEVSADIWMYGHEKYECWFEVRPELGTWKRFPLEKLENDRFGGSCVLDQVGLLEFRVGGTWLKNGQESSSDAYDLVVDPVVARYGSWYTMWPRSQGTDPSRSATWDECIARLPEIAAMGFTVLYVPPIHPIGKTNRKGKNNNVKSQPGEPGCPYAIGNELGGHDAIDPELGTMEDFERFVAACEALGMQVALDIALNASPDHPYAKDHPDWFYREADGTIKYAENPPKKYEDIYAFHYFGPDTEGMWREFLRVHLFWISKGVRLFRIDNPHTKPFSFWQWLIRETKKRCPDAVFLAEAFTRPKPMKRLAKLGFQQSYTYFVWREKAAAMREYVEELTGSPERLYMRPNFFTNTPDINPHHCQDHGRPAFLVRTAMAALLSPSWGIYNSWELCEATPVPGKEEYLDSEKYQYKTWDWNRPGHIKGWITLLNEIRATHPALQEWHNVRFLDCTDPEILAFVKTSGEDRLLVVINCDYTKVRNGWIDAPWAELGIQAAPYHVTDLVTKERWLWNAGPNWVNLDPAICPAHVFKIG